MPIEVEGTDGRVFEFPDGTDAGIMRRALAKAYARPSAVGDALGEFAKGVPRGLADMAELPAHVGGWLANKMLGTNEETGFGVGRAVHAALPARPETDAGRYAASAGEAVGASLVPMAGMYAAAPRLAAAAPATTWLGRAVQGGAEQIVANPVRSAAVDLAGAAASGVARQGAEDAGYGRLGQFAASVAGGMAPGVGAAYMGAARGSTAPIGSQTAQTVARRRQIEADRDAVAFAESGVRPFGPAFNQGPVASVGKQITETPLIGAPLRNNLDETYHDLAAAAQRTAAEISPTATAETAGSAVQRGLERFKTSRLADLEPAAVRALGVEAERMGPRHSVMSAGAARDASQAAPIRAQIGANSATTTRGASVPAARPLSQSMMMRTTAETLTDQELATIVRTPAAQTSVAARAEALYERAWRMVPELRRANDTRNPNLVNAAATRRALADVQGNIANNISGQGTINGALADRLRNPQSNMTLSDLRAIRTEIGRSLSGYNPLAPNTLDRTQLRQLYAATSNDIEVALQTLANRAAIRTQRPAGAADAVTEDTARQAASALHAFRTADRYFRMSLDRMDRFTQVLGAQSPELAARRLVQAGMDGTRGNVRMVRAAMAGLRPEERAEFGALAIREMGTPIASARGIVQESGFSAQSFATRYRQMSPEARELFFGPEHQRAIDNLFRMSNRIANVEALANTSRSGTNALNVTASIGGISSIARGDIATPLLIGGGGLAASLLMSSPRYTNWMARYIQLRANVRDGTDRSVAPLLRHVGALERGARVHPDLWPAYFAVTRDVDEIKGRGDANGRAN